MSFENFKNDCTAAIKPKAITGMLVSAIMVVYIGYMAIGMLLNTTLMSNNGITGTNATLLQVVALMIIVTIVVKFAPK